MIGREEARLRAWFERLLLLPLAAGPLACSGSGGGSAPQADAAPGAGVDAAPGTDGGSGLGDGGGSVADAGFADAACDPIPGPGSADSCDFLVTLPCGLPPDTATSGCYVALAECAVLCGQAESLQRTCAVAECLDAGASTIPEAGAITLECATGAPQCGGNAGRRPAGLLEAPPLARDDGVGEALAEMARLEAASVHAFRRLARELVALRAPAPLVRAAERSARDESRHARAMARLARRRGAVPARVRLRALPGARSLEAFAIENAVEGCVRETFGALVALRQSRRARDGAFARQMARIARDEVRHAALAWSIARWVEPRLPEAARTRVHAATRAAVGALRCEVRAVRPEIAAELGLPYGRDGAELVAAFEQALLA
jgi:hypothetical protein